MIAFYQWFVDRIQDIVVKLNEYSFDGVPLAVLLVSFVVMSIVISVFWKGARG